MDALALGLFLGALSMFVTALFHRQARLYALEQARDEDDTEQLRQEIAALPRGRAKSTLQLLLRFREEPEYALKLERRWWFVGILLSAGALTSFILYLMYGTAP